MKLSRILLCASIGVAAVGATHAAKPKSYKDWERCRDKAESSVNQLEVGIVGVETEIKMRCGAPPAKEPNSLTGAVGMHPYHLVRSKAWKGKFAQITKAQYPAFVDRLVVSSETTLEGDWIVGQGQAPHMGGIDDAALAINAKTGKVFAAMMEGGNKFRRFGFDSWESAPPYLQQWFSEYQK